MPAPLQVAEKEAETDRKRAIIEASKQSEVAGIRNEMAVQEKASKKRMAQIEGVAQVGLACADSNATDEMLRAREKARVDAEFYSMQKQAEANKVRLKAWRREKL